MNAFPPRAAAIALAVASVLALAPPAGAQPCPHAAADYVCFEQNVDVPNGLPTQLNPVISAVEHRYYVYFAVAECKESIIGDDCTGQGEGPGTVTNTIGIVYYESNFNTGLQRFQFWTAGNPNPIPADTIVLI